MYEIKNFKPRLYQETILNTCIKKDSLVVLPTGTGKTAIAILLAAHLLNNFPTSKILVLAPSKPLVAQHLTTFKKHLNVNPEEMVLFTGHVNPEERGGLWKKNLIIFSTPQCIENDLTNNRINLKDVSLVVFDEAHHAVQDYSYVKVAKAYHSQAVNPKVLALTASPGGTKAKIDEICKNLGIESVEIRTEEDDDVKPYIEEKKIEWVQVELPESMKTINKLIKESYKKRLKELKKFGVTKPASLINKRDLIKLQGEFIKKIERGNKTVYWAISLVAQAIKLSYASELIETQGLAPLEAYWKKLSEETSRAAKSIIYEKDIAKARQITKELIENGKKHPKMWKLRQLVEENIGKDSNIKIMIFANFRNTVNEIISNLQDVPGAKPIKLVGQKDGLTQKEQIGRLKEFGEGKYNILIGTCIIEEGIDVTSADLAIFYEVVPSEIRKIQRMGRVGRTQKGKIIFLMTKNSRDQAYYWSARKKENIMKKTLYNMKGNKTQTKLSLF